MKHCSKTITLVCAVLAIVNRFSNQEVELIFERSCFFSFLFPLNLGGNNNEKENHLSVVEVQHNTILQGFL